MYLQKIIVHFWIHKKGFHGFETIRAFETFREVWALHPSAQIDAWEVEGLLPIANVEDESKVKLMADQK